MYKSMYMYIYMHACMYKYTDRQTHHHQAHAHIPTINPHLGVDDGLAEVGHEADEGGVPLVGDLGEGRLAGGHEHLW